MNGIRTELRLRSDGNDRVDVYSQHYQESVWFESYPFGRRSPKRVARIVERAGRRLLKKEAQRDAVRRELLKKGIS